jgi:hypothetical protein
VSDWKAQIDPDMGTFGERLKLYRRTGDVVEFVAGFDDSGGCILQRTVPGVSTGFDGLLLPAGALEAVADLIKPGPSQGEMRAVTEALDLERRRIDVFLADLSHIVRRP